MTLQAPLLGARYRCVTCPSYSLCAACFAAGHHLQHNFAAGGSGLADAEVLVQRPAAALPGLLCVGCPGSMQAQPQRGARCSGGASSSGRGPARAGGGRLAAAPAEAVACNLLLSGKAAACGGKLRAADVAPVQPLHGDSGSDGGRRLRAAVRSCMPSKAAAHTAVGGGLTSASLVMRGTGCGAAGTAQQLMLAPPR